MSRRSVAVLCAVVVLGVPVASASAAPNNNNSAKLTSAVTVEGIREHLTAFQSIATANGGNRFAGLPGHDASAQYVYDRARAAGYSVRFQEFTYTAQEDLSLLVKTAPAPPKSYVRFQDFLGATTSVTGDVTAALIAVDLKIPPTGGSTSGCEPGDFTGFTVGAIALSSAGPATSTSRPQRPGRRRHSGRRVERGQHAGPIGCINPHVTGTTIPVSAHLRGRR